MAELDLEAIRARVRNLAEVRAAGDGSFAGLLPEQLRQIAAGYDQDVPALLDRIAALEAQDAASEHNAVQQWQTINKQNDYIATLERERAEERKQNAAAMAIVRAVANNGYRDVPGYHSCWFCPEFDEDVPHAPDCPVTQARSLLAAQENNK